MKSLIVILSLVTLGACASKPAKKSEDVVSTQQSATENNVVEEKVQISQYTVEKGDTLMWIAYKLYGDFTRWRELAAMNPGVNVEDLTIGSAVNYEVPDQEFYWREDGIAYRIERGDTLGKISNKVYGTPTYWKMIWENNSRMIRDPNKIYAGFTLFYKQRNRISLY